MDCCIRVNDTRWSGSLAFSQNETVFQWPTYNQQGRCFWAGKAVDVTTRPVSAAEISQRNRLFFQNLHNSATVSASHRLQSAKIWSLPIASRSPHEVSKPRHWCFVQQIDPSGYVTRGLYLTHKAPMSRWLPPGILRNLFGLCQTENRNFAPVQRTADRRIEINGNCLIERVR